MDFQSLKNSVNNAITKNLNNYTVGTKQLVLNKLNIDDKNLEQLMSWSNMQKVKNKNRSLTVPIYADITLKDNNKIVSTGKHINIGQLPIQTKNDSFLVNGIEYIVPLQLRRDPGVYTSLSENGMFVSAINSSKGRNYKIELDPNTNVQKINIDGTKIPLLPILNKLGFKKDQIIKTWGGDNNAKMLYEINEVAANTSQGKKALEKLYKKLEYNAKPNATEAEMLLAVNEYLKNKTAFNPIVNKVTLGKPYATLTPGAILDVSKKLFDISGKKADFDDTENLLFKHVKLPYDLVEEKINQDFKKKLTASLNRNLKNFNTVKDIIRPGLFTKSLKSFFNESQISEPSEMVNPLHILSTRDKITLKGEGGITDEHTVSMGMKSLHPSYFGFIDPLHTPDGSAGLVNHLSHGASVLRSNGKLTNQFYDMKTGKVKIFSVADVYNKRIGKPDQYNIEPGKRPKPKFKKIKVFIGNKSEEVSPDKVDLVLAHGSYVYDPSTNLVPFINSSSGNRISMSGKHSEQTISLMARESPLVSTLTRNKREFVKAMGERASILSPVDGQIRKITPTEIFIQDKKKKIHKVELRKNFELNQESFFTDDSIVSLGQKVKKDELIAQNNWIDKKGNLALGINAKVGYFPYKGYNIEDGVVISENFAKKLTSQHLHVQDLKISKKDLNLSKFKLNFKNKYTPENFSKLDSDGVVTKGSTVTQGNILIAHAIPFEVSEEDKILGKLSKGFKKRLRDQSVVWNYDFPGKVVDVIKSENLVKVKVLSEQPAQVTDKLAGRFGNKGIISNIVPDNEMPHTADGDPLEVIMNIHGVASRINPSQLYEAALGKIAKQTGKKYLIDNFGHANNWEYVDNELKKHNIHANETVIDPVTNKELKSWNPSTNKFENPFIGIGYINKSVHQTRKKFDARSRGTYSTIDMPSKNPEASHYMGNSASKQNPKSVDRLTLYSLLANGSKDVIRDMFVNKGQRRDDVWDAIINGSSLPPPKISTATQKFLALLKAAGVNTERKGRFISNPVLTDKDTLKMSSGKIPKPNQFLRGKDLMPIRGGMFDPILTGGTENSTRYNHIDLNTKIPNPITKNAIKILLDLTEPEFNDILSGKKNMQGLTGASFFEKKLKEIDPKVELAKIESQKINAPKSKINLLNRKLRYLRALVNNGIKPEEYMISKLPIIPSKFRPILQLPNGTIEPAPINNLYRDVALATKLANEKSFPKFLKNDATHELYNTVSGLIGVTEPTVNTQNSLIKARNIKSVLTEIGGSGSPKGGFLHSKILAKTQDLIGNSVIAIGPDLGIDEIGIPFKMAETIYEPWILNKLKNMGQKISNVDYKLLREKNPALIKSVLNQIVKERPVIVNRNPSLHKGSIMAFNPVLITGDAIKLNPLILKPFNADFDGDQMPVHVPISNQAVKQAYQMIPSLNYYDPKNDLSNINFDQEYVAGISLMTENGRKTNYSYNTLAEAKEAYKKNEIRINDFIKVGGKENTLGRLELSDIIPKELGISVNKVFTNADIKKMLNTLEKDGSITKYTDFINKLKDAAAKYSYDEGFSFSLDDIKPRQDIRSKILNPAISLINKAKTEDAKKSIIRQYAGNAQKFLVNDVNKQHNRFFLPAAYGSRKISPDVMQQITVTPFYASGMKDKLVDTPIGKSYSEGLDIHDNFLMAYGARKALVDKVSSVQDPGVLTKELIGSFSGVNISANDCGTTDGVYVDIPDTFNLQGRVLAEKTNGVSAGTVLDAKALVDLRKGKDTRIKVRSPLTCKMPNGICGKCYGWNEYQQLPKIGYPAGIQAAQSIGETGTQSALSSHHLGGTVSGGSFRSGFDMTKFLLHMPENVKNKATLSQVEGTVTSIKKGVNNQHIIIIDTDPSPYIARNELLVKTGDKVKKGQALDNGTIKLQELADLVPMNKVQDFLTTELEKSYSGTKILRRNTETIVKGVTGYSKVSNPGKSPYLEEQVVPNNLIEAIRKEKPILTEDAIGWRLDESVGGYKKGDLVTIDIANDLLEKKGVKYVRVNGDGLQVKNQLIGIHSIPLVQPDLLKKMSFQRIKAALKEGPISGEYSNVHGMFPEPALTVATEFGLPGYDYY